MKKVWVLGVGCWVLGASAFGHSGVQGPDNINSVIEPIRAAHSLPAMAGAVVMNGEIHALGALGVRKAGSNIAVTLSDQFHLGSDTKAMTALLIAMLIDEGKLRWDSKLIEIFPELREPLTPRWRDVTVEQILAHRGGFAENSWPMGKTFRDIHALPGDTLQQKMVYLRMCLQDEPVAKPGEKFVYSNRGYAILGAIAERLTGKRYEDLLTARLFKPLGMTTAGFGPMGTPGKIDQPLQHEPGHKPVEPTAFSDNPPAITPAGRVHCSIEDWAKFVKACLARDPRLLKSATWERYFTPLPGAEYVSGWLVVDRKWAGGRAYSHSGSNTINYCTAWIAPNKQFAAIVATNEGGASAEKACDEAIGAMIQKYLH